MKTFVAGLGEVGKALIDVLSRYYEVIGYDIGRGESFERHDDIEILHICFPFSENFIVEVKKYQDALNPQHTVIHSTVPVGTSAVLGATHSPIRGIHPSLREGIGTFVKFLGGPQASKVADYFRRANMRIYLCDKAETTELAKLLDTEYYRECIEFAQRAKILCDKLGVPYAEAYTIFNQTYNDGYEKLGHSEYIRPVLSPIMEPIGGKCVLPNKKIMEDMIRNLDSGVTFAQYIRFPL